MTKPTKFKPASKKNMTPTRPYVLRAFYDWIVDNNCTPHVVINAKFPGVEVPEKYVDKEGQIVLNIAPIAVKDLNLGDKTVEFDAMFGGTSYHIIAPVFAIVAIYAKENGRGMVFDDGEDISTRTPRVLSDDEFSDVDDMEGSDSDDSEFDDAGGDDDSGSEGKSSGKRNKGGKPFLTVVK